MAAEDESGALHELIITDVPSMGNFRFVVFAGPNGSLKITSQEQIDRVYALADAVRNSIPPECRKSADFAKLSAPERDRHMRTVMRQGWGLFRAMAPDALKREQFRRLLAAHAGIPIRVIQEAACFPWEALCLAEDLRSATHRDFLGWNHALIRETVEYNYSRRDAGKAGNTPKVGLIEDDGLPSVVNASNRAAAAHIGPSTRMKILPPLAGSGDIQILEQFFADTQDLRNIYQFDCHIDNPSKDVRTSHMRVSQAFPYHFNDMQSLVVLNNPFVLLNACEGGTVGVKHTEGYAEKLQSHGAKAVVAAEARIGDDFAVSFASLFYRVARKSTEIAEALLKTRRLILAQDHNPSVLFYGLYGDFSHDLSDASPGAKAAIELGNYRLSDVWPPSKEPSPDFR
ncbi:MULTISPECIES: CHAT domain-containing protein [unclassified Bradyrhizobium]|uniref:CHAT domain-containing protein n=1 Tax=unclassified Bradyrhizobium TaxID=2631580 RepID=UPI002916261D|nr:MULTISPECIES: CHAT domain-containing protein [unclassified Bradyrhizobium]